jgi:hypothetical protein
MLSSASSPDPARPGQTLAPKGHTPATASPAAALGAVGLCVPQRRRWWRQRASPRPANATPWGAWSRCPVLIRADRGALARPSARARGCCGLSAPGPTCWCHGGSVTTSSAVAPGSGMKGRRCRGCADISICWSKPYGCCHDRHSCSKII